MGYKKLLSFSDSMVLELIKDMAEARHCGESAVVESLVTEKFLPKNSIARHILNTYLYAEDGNVQKCLYEIFKMNAAGTDGKSKFDNLYPLVDFITLYGLDNRKIENDKSFKDTYILKQWDDIITILQTHQNEVSEYAIKCAKETLDILNTTPKDIYLHDFFYILTNCWHVLNDKTQTYRFLMKLTLACELENTSHNRVELVKAIKEIAKGWD